MKKRLEINDGRSVDLKGRTKQFAINIMKLLDEFPDNRKGRIIQNQLGRAGTSVGANYRAACRGRSKAEFIAKVGVVIEESDECAYWLEIAEETGVLTKEPAKPLWSEANERTAIMTTSRKNCTKRVVSAC